MSTYLGPHPRPRKSMMEIGSLRSSLSALPPRTDGPYDDDEEEEESFVHDEDRFPPPQSTLSALKDDHRTAGARGTTTTTATKTTKGTLQVLPYFALWFALNAAYNVLNKKVLNALPCPVTIGSAQLAVGSAFVLARSRSRSLRASWGPRRTTTPPHTRLNPKGRSAVRHIGVFHVVGHLLMVFSLGAGSVSFTHIIKASEPFFFATLSALAGRGAGGRRSSMMRPQVYASLIPVVGGVGYACLGSGSSYSSVALLTALGSNVANALRAVKSKAVMGESGWTLHLEEELTATELFAAVTVQSFLMSVPFAILGEGASFLRHWSSATARGGMTAEMASAPPRDPSIWESTSSSPACSTISTTR